MIFYTSDNHFGHERINELADRPFASVAEADEAMIERWNSVVGPDDTVYILGDVAMGSLEESLAKVARLEGLKFLVPGNHDRVSTLYRGSEAKKGEWRVAYREAGLRVLPPEMDTMLGDTCVTLCHFPFDGDSHGEDRYASSRPVNVGQILLHGHTHSKDRIRGRQVHVGVDAWDFTPVAEQTLLDLLNDEGTS